MLICRCWATQGTRASSTELQWTAPQSASPLRASWTRLWVPQWRLLRSSSPTSGRKFTDLSHGWSISLMHTSSILPMEARGTSGSSNERVLNKPSFIIIRNKILLQPASRCLKCFLKKHPSRVTYRRSPDIFRANFFFPRSWEGLHRSRGWQADKPNFMLGDSITHRGWGF